MLQSYSLCNINIISPCVVLLVFFLYIYRIIYNTTSLNKTFFIDRGLFIAGMIVGHRTDLGSLELGPRQTTYFRYKIKFETFLSKLIISKQTILLSNPFLIMES